MAGCKAAKRRVREGDGGGGGERGSGQRGPGGDLEGGTELRRAGGRPPRRQRQCQQDEASQAPRGVPGGHERDGTDDPIRELRFDMWPKTAVMGIRPGRQLSGDKRPTRPGLDDAIGVRRGTASKTPFRCRARAGRLKIAGENRWCRRGTNVTKEEEEGGAIAHRNPGGATHAVLRTQVGDLLAYVRHLVRLYGYLCIDP